MYTKFCPSPTRLLWLVSLSWSLSGIWNQQHPLWGHGGIWLKFIVKTNVLNEYRTAFACKMPSPAISMARLIRRICYLSLLVIHNPQNNFRVIQWKYTKNQLVGNLDICPKYKVILLRLITYGVKYFLSLLLAAATGKAGWPASFPTRNTTHSIDLRYNIM